MPLGMIVYKKTDEWYIEWQRVVQRVTTSGTKSDNEWQRMVQRVTTNDNEWVFRPIFFFFQEERTNRHPKDSPLNLDEDLEESLLN